MDLAAGLILGFTAAVGLGYWALKAFLRGVLWAISKWM